MGPILLGCNLIWASFFGFLEKKKKLQKQLVYHPNYKRKRAGSFVFIWKEIEYRKAQQIWVFSSPQNLSFSFLHFGTDSQKQLGKERTNWIFEELILCAEKAQQIWASPLLFFGFLARGFVFLMLAALHWYCCFWSSIHPLHSGAEWIMMPFCLDSLCFFLLNWNWVLFVL